MVLLYSHIYGSTHIHIHIISIVHGHTAVHFMIKKHLDALLVLNQYSLVGYNHYQKIYHRYFVITVFICIPAWIPSSHLYHFILCFICRELANPGSAQRRTMEPLNHLTHTQLTSHYNRSITLNMSSFFSIT